MEFAVTTHPARNEDVAGYAANAYEQGFKNIHIDFMDGKFTNKPASSPKEALQIARSVPAAKICVHIMAKNPQKHAKKFARQNCEIVFQIETAKKPLKILKKHAHGIAVDLNTKIENISNEVFAACKTVLIMLVKAGESGQTQKPQALEKIKWLKEHHPSIKVIADGGINNKTLNATIKSGADVLSLGSFAYSLIKNKTAKQFFRSLHM